MHVEKLLELNGHAAAIYTLDFDGKYLYSGSGDRFVARWNTETGTQDHFSIRCEDPVYKLLLRPEAGQLLLGTGKGALHVIDIAARKEIKHFTAHKSALFSLLENKTKQHIYSADADGNLAVWEADTWEMLLFLPFDCGKIRGLTVSASGDELWMCCQDGKIRCLDTRNFNEKWAVTAHEGGIFTLCELEGGRLASGGKDGHIRIWDRQQTLPQQLRAIPAHYFGIYQLLPMDATKLVSISRDKSIKIWSIPDFEVLARIERKQGGHSHSVNAASLMAPGCFATAGDDKRIICWSLH